MEINRFAKTILQKPGICCIFQIGIYPGAFYIIGHRKEDKDNMSEKKIIVSNVEKEHENPIAELVQVACQFDSEITLESDEKRINAKSIMGIMAFNPSKGMTVNIVADGRDEEEALVAMEKFLVCL